MTPRPISRRRVIVLGGLGVAGVVTGVTGWIAGTAGVGSGTAGAGSGDQLQPATTGAELAQPLLLDSRDGRLEVALAAAPGARIAGRDTSALGYNGTSPGPTLRIRPGDELAVRLTNGLDQPTNLHTHGLRVSPQVNSDNPFITIDPGASFDYLYRISPDHPTGTNWYHAHHHGTVADQIFGGLVGALLVEGEPDLPVAVDRVLLVSDTTPDAGGRIVAAGAMDRAMGRQGELVLVNGQHQPSIPATPDAAQRWRLINTCTSRVLDIRLAGRELRQVALDGTFLPVPASRSRVVLAPGNRADVVVRPSGAGSHTLTAEPVDRGGMGNMMGGAPATSGPVTLATMVTGGASARRRRCRLRCPPRHPPRHRDRSATDRLPDGHGRDGLGWDGVPHRRARLRRRPRRPDSVPDVARVLAMNAHPDDESFGMGAMLDRWVGVCRGGGAVLHPW